MGPTVLANRASRRAAVGALVRQPKLMSSSAARLRENYAWLQGLVGEAAARQALSRCPTLFQVRLESPRRVVRFLEGLGLESAEVQRVLHRSPSLLISDPELLGRRRDWFRDRLGLEAGPLVLKLPALLMYSIEGNLDVKLRYLEAYLDRAWIAERVRAVPASFAYSLQRRIAPRVKFAALRGASVRRAVAGLPGDDRKFAKEVGGEDPHAYRRFLASYAAFFDGHYNEFVAKLKKEPAGFVEWETETCRSWGAAGG